MVDLNYLKAAADRVNYFLNDNNMHLTPCVYKIFDLGRDPVWFFRIVK